MTQPSISSSDSNCLQIAEALEFLEQKSVLFRDLKGQNILVFSTRIEDDVNVKLTDFGLAVHSAPYGLKVSSLKRKVEISMVDSFILRLCALSWHPITFTW